MSNFSKIQYYMYALYDFNDLSTLPLLYQQEFHLAITFTIPSNTSITVVSSYCH